ncbi:hypothetical protein [Formosa sp. PL04]|uniref:hypothetical protein n=1 Tax=Formosa sp. PL04 TaxID=3081755 RepID=UPI0029819861|nr:hypothetical protein [Formosa sp. PL04]MDW5290806.1 hypothetical protein [Formosa sp. PL04]
MQIEEDEELVQVILDGNIQDVMDVYSSKAYGWIDKCIPLQSSEICDYYKYHAFMQLHAIFNKLEKAGKFTQFNTLKPILFLGRGHDEAPVLIYKTK